MAGTGSRKPPPPPRKKKYRKCIRPSSRVTRKLVFEEESEVKKCDTGSNKDAEKTPVEPKLRSSEESIKEKATGERLAKRKCTREVETQSNESVDQNKESPDCKES